LPDATIHEQKAPARLDVHRLALMINGVGSVWWCPPALATPSASMRALASPCSWRLWSGGVPLSTDRRYNGCMEHFGSEIGWCAGNAQFELELRGSTARVCLMDADNYQAYVNDEDYHFYGGFGNRVPSRWRFRTTAIGTS
jgi:hypothetical protein